MHSTKENKKILKDLTYIHLFCLLKRRLSLILSASDDGLRWGERVYMYQNVCMGSGYNSSVVTASDSWSKGPGFESRQERRENFLLLGQLSVLTLISVSVPHPRYLSST